MRKPTILLTAGAILVVGATAGVLAAGDLKKDREQVRTVLLHHVVDGRFRAGRLLRAESVESLAGPRLHVRKRKGGVRVAGAKVVQPNVAASNGVVHAINRVLIPPSD